MEKFKSKNYHILKIRYYASDYLLKKWYDTDTKENPLPSPRQH